MKSKNIFQIIILLYLVLPVLSYAENDSNKNFEEMNINSLSLEEAEILVLMNTEGELNSSYTIHNLNNEDTYIISIKENNLQKLYLVEQDGKIELIEKFDLNTKRIIF